MLIKRNKKNIVPNNRYSVKIPKKSIKIERTLETAENPSDCDTDDATLRVLEAKIIAKEKRY